jgi:hypothetical protein
MNYKGYIIKQVTERDVKNGSIPDYKLGEFYVFTRDNEIEYDGCETIEEAKEQVEGLVADRNQTAKSKLRKRLAEINTHIDEYNKKHNLVNYDNLNSRDGCENVLNDPAINDYLKGYQIDPYEFKQWASKKLTSMDKTAAQEVDVMKFTPDYLADKILMLWNGSDSCLQNFYDAFTLRYPNKLTKDIADELNKRGYKIFPTLVDDRPRYAEYKNKFRTATASYKHNEAITCLSGLKEMNPFKDSIGFNCFINEIEGLNNSGLEVIAADMEGILEYYKQIFPDDFAITLTTNFIKKPEETKKYDVSYDRKDQQLSDESLNAIENYMSGNADPYGENYSQGGYPGGYFGYDTTTQMRSDIGVPPTSYETRASKKKDLR